MASRRGSEFYRWIIEQGFPSGYQVLCGQCNYSKGAGVMCLIHGKALAPLQVPVDTPHKDQGGHFWRGEGWRNR
jgi:hypothetical protein